MMTAKRIGNDFKMLVTDLAVLVSLGHRNHDVINITVIFLSLKPSGTYKLIGFNQVHSTFKRQAKRTNNKKEKSFIIRNDNVRNVTLQKKWFDLESDSVASDLVEMIYSRPSPVSNTKLL